MSETINIFIGRFHRLLRNLNGKGVPECSQSLMTCCCRLLLAQLCCVGGNLLSQAVSYELPASPKLGMEGCYQLETLGNRSGFSSSHHALIDLIRCGTDKGPVKGHLW